MIKTAGALIIKDGKFLLLKRADKRAFASYWTLPGGHVEENESSENAAKREIKEETNLDFKPIFFKKYEEDFPEFDWKAEVKIFYGKFEGDIKIDRESSEFGWFSLDEIKKMNLAFNHKEIINDFIKYGN